MTLSDLIDYTRKHVLRDNAVPPLWPDDLIVAYLNEAQQKVASRTHELVLADRELSLDADAAVYTLDPDVVQVYNVRLSDYFERLVPLTENWTPVLDITSRPTHFNTDRATQTITFYPTPDTAYTAILRIARLPADLTLDDVEAEPEIKAQYHLQLADWAAYRCFGNDDADGRNDGAAANAEKRWNLFINEVKRDEYKLRTGHGMRAHGDRVK